VLHSVSRHYNLLSALLCYSVGCHFNWLYALLYLFSLSIVKLTIRSPLPVDITTDYPLCLATLQLTFRSAPPVEILRYSTLPRDDTSDYLLYSVCRYVSRWSRLGASRRSLPAASRRSRRWVSRRSRRAIVVCVLVVGLVGVLSSNLD
jgi:hypothetical protein